MKNDCLIAFAKWLLGFLAGSSAVIFLWYVANPYRGITHDALLYSIQALARLHPASFAHDVFLENVSQDAYTLFTPIYAFLIAHLGLQIAATSISCATQLWFWICTWLIARRLMSRELAWLGASATVIVPMFYGGHGIFEVVEEFTSARPVAECLALTAIVLRMHSQRVLSTLTAILSLVVHPLMAFPALLILAAMGTDAAKHLTFRNVAIASIAVLVLYTFASFTGIFSRIDAEWLAVVRSRSAYLFVNEWIWSDWQQLFAAIGGCVLVLLLAEENASGIVAWSLFMGIAGILLTALTSWGNPIAIVVQGQPWRWMWVSVLLSVLWLPSVVGKLIKEGFFGKSCALLALLGILVPSVYGIFVLLSASLWGARKKLSASAVKLIAIGSIGIFAVACIWTIAVSWGLLNIKISTGFDPPFITRLRNITSLGLPAFALLALAWWVLVVKKSSIGRIFILSTAVFSLYLVLPSAWARWKDDPDLSQKLRAHLEEWRRAIPLDAEVLWLETPQAVWFMLDRPSYVSRAQAAGVVFSRETAIELNRRAQNIRIWAGDYILGKSPDEKDLRPLSSGILAVICLDPVLDFVVGEAGAAQGTTIHGISNTVDTLTLYDCSNFRLAS